MCRQCEEVVLTDTCNTIDKQVVAWWTGAHIGLVSVNTDTNIWWVTGVSSVSTLVNICLDIKSLLILYVLTLDSSVHIVCIAELYNAN